MCQEFINEMPLEQHQRRVQVAKKVEEAPLETVELIENIATPVDVEAFSPLELQQIISTFGQYVSSEAESEEIDGRRLHVLLEGAICAQLGARDEDPVGDAVRMGWRDPEAIGYTGVAVGYEGMAHDLDEVPMTDGLVEMKQTLVDMYSDDHDHVFAVLDEGCNTTCHSRRWAEMAEKRLEKRGLTFPFTDESPKKFTGLGAGNTDTDGVRALPFALALVDHDGDKQIVNGIMHSHQLSAGSAPLLISLHAQAHMKLTKDMANGTIKIGDMILPTSRCKKTGLIMVNLTEGIDIKGFAKCHRSLRLKDESMPTVGSNSFVGSTDMSRRDVEAVVKRLRGGVCPVAQSSAAGLGYGVQALVTTRGVRFTPAPSGNHGRERLLLDCRSIHDPDASNHLRGHLGSHCEVLRGVAGQRATRDLMEKVRDFLNTSGDKMVWIDFYCTSGRHRAVALSVPRRDFLNAEEDFICHCSS